MIVRTSILASMLLMPLSGASSVPPPPSLPGQDAVATQLVHAIQGKDVAAYAALLSEDVQVFADGRIIARDKQEWLEIFGPKLSAEGVFFRLSPGFSSTGRLLFIEYFNSTGSWGGDAPRDCCWSSDAVSYDISDGKIVTIRSLTGGESTLNAQGAIQ